MANTDFITEERLAQYHDELMETHIAGGAVFDISAYHASGNPLTPATYADLAAALGTNGANIPPKLRRPGMRVQFVQSSDNKYVQYRLMSDTFNTTVANWQGVDDNPTPGSENLVKSGGVYSSIVDVKNIIGCVRLSDSILKFVDKKTINPGNGELSTNNNTIALDTFVKIEGTKIKFCDHSTTANRQLRYAVAFYNSSKGFITRTSLTAETEYDVPQNAAYFRVSIGLYINGTISGEGEQENFELDKVSVYFDTSQEYEIDGIKKDIVDLNDDITSIEHDISEINDDISEINDDISEIDKKILDGGDDIRDIENALFEYSGIDIKSQANEITNIYVDDSGKFIAGTSSFRIGYYVAAEKCKIRIETKYSNNTFSSCIGKVDSVSDIVVDGSCEVLAVLDSSLLSFKGNFELNAGEILVWYQRPNVATTNNLTKVEEETSKIEELDERLSGEVQDIAQDLEDLNNSLKLPKPPVDITNDFSAKERIYIKDGSFAKGTASLNVIYYVAQERCIVNLSFEWLSTASYNNYIGKVNSVEDISVGNSANVISEAIEPGDTYSGSVELNAGEVLVLNRHNGTSTHMRDFAATVVSYEFIGNIVVQQGNEIEEIVKSNPWYAEENGTLPSLPENPIEKITPEYIGAGIIHDWAFLGDSLASGTMTANEENITDYRYSWPQVMCRLLGVKGYNYSHGGATSFSLLKTYFNEEHGAYDEFSTNRNGYASNVFITSHVHQAYVISIGANDRSSGQIPYGDVSTDIDLSDWHNNAETYAGNLGQIIQRIREVAPNSVIFVTTEPKGRGNENYNNVCRDLAGIFSKLYIIDLHEYSVDFSSNSFKGLYFNVNHMKHIGYIYAAIMIMTYIDRIIRENISDFADIQTTLLPTPRPSGTFSQKPTVNIPIGYKYFCISGATVNNVSVDNIPIYYTGSGWVDATGRVVS